MTSDEFRRASLNYSPRGRGMTNNYGSTGTPVVGRFGEEYDELLGGSVPCPSCMGAGRIPKERECEMVALIPLNDKRLKPRRTTLYVLLAIAICALLTGLLVFFLFPRSVNINSNMPLLKPKYTFVNVTQKLVFLTVVNEYNVTNTNFFSVDLTEMNITSYFDQRVIGKNNNVTHLTVPLRSQRTYRIAVNLTFSGDEGYISQYCSEAGKYGHTLLLPFQASASVRSMGRTEQSMITTYQHVKCSTKD